MTSYLIGNLCLAFMATFLLVPIIRRWAVREGYVAKAKTGIRWKNRIVARLGGIAIFAGVMLSSYFFSLKDNLFFGYIIGAVIIFAAGLVDDIIHVKPYSKLLAQIIASCVIIYFGVEVKILPIKFFNVLLTIGWILFMTNALNLLDNMDGLASGISFIASSFLAIYGFFANDTRLVFLASSIAASSLAFLYYNFNPAKIFMGDCGSQFLGFSLAYISLMCTWREATGIVSILSLPVLILSVPIFDTIFVTIMRTTNNRAVFKGGTDHLSHRLAILGLSEKKAVVVLYGISIVFGCIGLIGSRYNTFIFLAMVLLAFITLILLGTYLAKVKVYALERIDADRDPKDDNILIFGVPLPHKRRILEMLIDLLVIISCYLIAYQLRFEGIMHPIIQQAMWRSLPLFIVINLGTFYCFGLYRGIWRYISISDLITIFKAVSIGCGLSAISILYIWKFEDYSRAVLVINWLFLFIGVSASRIGERVLKEYFTKISNSNKGRRVFIFGAGDAGEKLLREVRNNSHLNYTVVGFIDDDASKIGRKIHGLPILGNRNELPLLIKDKQIDEVLVAISALHEADRKQIREICQKSGIRVKETGHIFKDADI